MILLSLTIDIIGRYKNVKNAIRTIQFICPFRFAMFNGGMSV